MPDRVLVTGATGFVGSHITQAFVEAGYEVRCGLRASSDPRWISDLPVEPVPLDLTRQEEDLVLPTANIDVVVHAAGLTRARRAGDYHLINAEGTRRLAVAAAKAGVRRFVLISSLAARGPNIPAKNGRDRPTSAYGRSKLEAEAHLWREGEQMETCALRPAAVYGPRDTDLLLLFKMARSGWLIIPPSESNLLQPVYATDVARATLAAAHEPAGFGPYPVAETTRYTWQEVTDGLEWALGRPVRVVRLPATAFKLVGRVARWTAKLRGAVPVFDERRAQDLSVHTWTCDPSTTEQTLGWRAEVRLFEGLERTARWYRQAGWM